MEMADGIAALVKRAISELSVVCTPLGGLHDCEWADYVVRRVVTLVLGFTVTTFECSRWRDGRFACYAPYVMLQRRAFNCDFRFPLIFLSQAKSMGCKRKKIQFP
jgi:hypothetical protein